MTAALSLLERGCNVTLFDADQRLGGKAGSQSSGLGYDDHGYHIFPPWYLNIWRLVDKLGIQDRFIDCMTFGQLRPGEFPNFAIFRDLNSLGALWDNIRSGLISPAENLLFYYSSLDLASQPYRYRSFLDQISVSGFIRSRFYRTETLAQSQQEFILKGLSAPSYELSAMTLRNVIRLWLRYRSPIYRILDGNMQERFIDPIEQRLRALGVTIRTSHRLERIEVRGGRVISLHIRDMTSEVVHREEVTEVILAIPHESLARLIDGEVYRADPALANVRYLQSRPMAALDICLTSKIERLPGFHVNCLDSRYGLSFLDVSQSWPGLTSPLLQVIASEFTPLAGLPTEVAVDEIVGDLRRYLPGLEPHNIARTVFQPHVLQPLSSNDVGSWTYRPGATTGLENLYLAGDFCRSPVDLVCQEGAVISGLLAADAVRQKLHLEPPIEILQAAIPPPWLLTSAKLGLMPLALCAKILTLFKDGRAGQ
jgi:uncharacterized protein with NAD-binding domain and iron-sulfur cluster